LLFSFCTVIIPSINKLSALSLNIEAIQKHIFVLKHNVWMVDEYGGRWMGVDVFGLTKTKFFCDLCSDFVYAQLYFVPLPIN
jgi:hypothetical protein